MYKPFLRFSDSFDFFVLSLAVCAGVTVEDAGAAEGAAPVGQRMSAAEILRSLPRMPNGDRVDWVKALRTGKITPQATVSGAGEQGIMDVDVPISAKGSMPDVVFPHKTHTEWLSCGNCHVGIYEMQRGVNAVGMMKIMRGESCGVCHGTVAFPLDDCMRCHSRPK